MSKEKRKKELPTDWKWVRIGDVCEKHTGMRDPRIEPGSTFRYIDISSVSNKEKRITEARYILGKDAPSRARQVVRTGDVIVATTRPNLNAVAQVPCNLDNQICSTGFCVLRSVGDILPDFLLLCVQHKLFVDALSDLVKGALYPAVNDNQVKAQLIPLPPIIEQERIVEIVRMQMAAVEKARVAAQERLEAVKALPAAILRQVFPQSRKELPNGWKWVKIGKVAQLINGRAYSGGELLSHGTYPVLRVGNLFTSNNWYYSNLELEPAKYCDKGDLLYAWSASFGPFIWSGPKVIFHYHIWKVVCSELLNKEFAFYALTFLTEQIKLQSHGLAMLHMTKENMENFEIPLPPFSEQQRILKKLHEQMSEINKVRTATMEELNSINALPAAILRRAFTGEF